MSQSTDLSQPAHWRFWPEGVPHALEVPDESLWSGLQTRAEQTPDAVGLDFLGRTFTWGELRQSAEHLAGALQVLGVEAGDRVILFMQNCPQFIIAFHALVRIGAVVVPVNPMNKCDELVHYVQDAAAHAAIASSDIAAELARASQAPQACRQLQHLVVFDLADALPSDAHEQIPQWPAVWQDWLPARQAPPQAQGVRVHHWNDLLAQALQPAGVQVTGADLALLPYTSGTTGAAKGCMHSHATLMHNVLAAAPWLDVHAGDVTLVVVPMFHITGLVMGMLASIRHGCKLVLLPRWDRRQAAQAIQQHRVTHWPNIPTMVIDLLGDPALKSWNLSSLRFIGGGGAAMPDAVAADLQDKFGLQYVEGYGLTETAAPTHHNPRHASRRHCLGIPYIGTEARIIDPETLQPVPTHEVGEIVVRGPQVFRGYWNQPEATQRAFITIDGQSFFRTGDLGRVDADGYFYMTDRLKRMINASGFKVWPAEVEALLHRHPAVQEACVISARDAYRGEVVKAVVVLRTSQGDRVGEADLIAWSREHMAAYKYPRIVEFVDALPRNASGKVMWRTLQDQQNARDPVLA
ncbi:MAG TPA: long-chain-fatty-acid--CoA ligase [Burkholderiales bacterium]|nr:long-chain-fatty-acid--CoA ligase [Burkholderiales bacterium]